MLLILLLLIPMLGVFSISTGISYYSFLLILHLLLVLSLFISFPYKLINWSKIYYIFFDITSIVIRFFLNRPTLLIQIFVFLMCFYFWGFETCKCQDVENICNDHDVSPSHANNLNVTYQKLLRLGSGGDNAYRTMSSPNLINGLEFTSRDRVTMHTQITEAYPNKLYRFTNINTPSTFNFPGTLTTEILDLFKPTYK